VKPVISALSRLTPVQVVDVATGEVLSWEVARDTLIEPLITWVRDETQRLYDENPEKLLKDALNLKDSAESYARYAGYLANWESLPREVKAKSRLGRLALAKLMGESASYVRNPNPRKQPHRFSRSVNLGTVDSHMCRLDREGDRLLITWKCWDKEIECEFLLPSYATERDITKISLPVVTTEGFIFTIQERPLPVLGDKTAGVDLGRVEPFTMAVLSSNGLLEAEYRARPQVRALNARRERILVEVAQTRVKADARASLKLDDTVHRREVARKRSKAHRIMGTLKSQIAADVSTKLERHSVAILNIEDLRWAAGAKYGSRWAHGMTAEKIEHTNARHGVRTKRVNPRGTSQHCHKCGTTIVHRTKNRTVWCEDCKTRLDRDVNAAMNIALNKSYPTGGNRPTGSTPSLTETVEQRTRSGASSHFASSLQT